MDNETRKRAADRDADEALDAILKEIDSDERKKPSEADVYAEQHKRTRSDAERKTGERRRPADTERTRPVSHAKEPVRSEGDGERPVKRSSQLHRLPAAAERPEERSQRLAAERARNAERSGERPVRRQPAERTERNPQRTAERTRSQQRPAERVPQRSAEQRTQRPAERAPQRSAEQRTQRPAERAPQRKAPAAESAARKTAQKRPAQKQQSSAAVKRKPSAFRIGMALYIIIFMLITMFLMHKLNVYLGEYESSLPQYTIDGYVSGLNSGFYTDMIRQKVDQIPVSAYETADSIAASLDIENVDAGTYTWAKNMELYTDETPVYYIRSGNEAIATVELKRIGGTENFDRPIWQACPAESLISISSDPQYSLDVTVPDGASVMVNGIAIPYENMEKDAAGLNLDNAALMYAQEPASLHVFIDGLYAAPKVQAYDSLGNLLTPAKSSKPTEANQVYMFAPKAEITPDEALVSRIEGMMRAYIDYMANKDEALWTNLGVLDTYLVPNSNAYSKLHGIAGDINWNNPYTARLDRALDVSNIRMYSDDVCTADVHYDYQLTKNVVNDYVGDMRWTFVKTGNGWNAVEFEITGSNDTDFENDDEESTAAEQP